MVVLVLKVFEWSSCRRFGNRLSTCSRAALVLTAALHQVQKYVHLLKLHSLTNVLEREKLLREFYDSYLNIFFPHPDQLDA